MATAWCDGGPVDGPLVPVELDRWNLTPSFLALPVLAVDEENETAWRYFRCPLVRAKA
jgi:hypothetical protein